MLIGEQRASHSGVDSSTSAGTDRRVWWDRIGLCVALAIGLTLIRWFWLRLGMPLWVDEQWRAYHAGFGASWWQELRSSPDGPLAAGWLLIELALTRSLGNTEHVLRLPVAFSFVGLALGMFVLSRRWLGVLAALLTTTSLLFTSPIVDFSTQLKPYSFEATITVATLLLWLRYEEQPVRGWQRPLLALGIALGCLCSTPTIFVLGPLLLLSALRTRRLWRRPLSWLRQLWSLILGGGLALLHLALFMLPQSRLTDSSYWDANFVPHRPLLALQFIGSQMLSYFPELQSWFDPQLPASSGWLQLLTAARLVFTLLGIYAATRDRAGRALLVALFGALALQLLAAYVRLWPFGNVRVNVFLTPLLWMLGALGVQWPLRWLTRGSRNGVLATSNAGRAALRWTCVVSGLLLGVLMTWVTWGQMHFFLIRQAHDRFGDGMRLMVADVLQQTTPTDLAVVIHPQARKGWEYYMRFYDYPAALRDRPRIAVERSLFISDPTADDRDVTDTIAQFPNATQVWIMALEGTQGAAINQKLDQLRAAGFSVDVAHAMEGTGVLWRAVRQSALAQPADLSTALEPSSQPAYQPHERMLLDALHRVF